MTDKLNWGIIGTGAIAKTFAKGVNNSKTGKLVAVGSRTQAAAEQFGDGYGVPKEGRHGSYEALLADKNVQAVYISTPHPMHAEWAIKAAEAGKHILCEKPIGLNHAEAMVIIDAARRNNVFLMEAFMYRCHPQIAKVVELIKSGAIGEVRMIQAAFSFHWPKPFSPEGRITSNALGGGGILDVGCYPVSLSRLVAGAALGKDFADPIDIKAFGHVGTTGVDEWTAAILKFPNDIVAQVSTGVQLNQENVARIYGYDGMIYIPSPWIPTREGGTSEIVLTQYGKGEPKKIQIEETQWLYSIEADTCAKFLAQKQASSPAMSWDDTLGNMKTLDAWRAQLGQAYDSEKQERFGPVANRPLKVKKYPSLGYGKIDGLDKQVSRVCVGADMLSGAYREGYAILDAAFEQGINCFDTGHIYGWPPENNSDSRLGHWLRTRGVRKDTVVLGKGAHTPNCNPKAMTQQLHESLQRLGVDHLDIYMLHRDNTDIPVGEFIDALNEHHKAGRIKAFGGSNWSLKRVQEANDYAKKKGLRGFTVLSNNFSLAHMVDPVWAGCIHSSDAASRAWLRDNKMALIPWSSQARGFFTDRANNPDAEMKRCWFSEDNLKRRARAIELAQKKGCEPINIALAYVLAQPFPTFPLIGPRALTELHSSLKALDVTLTADEAKWLALDA